MNQTRLGTDGWLYISGFTPPWGLVQVTGTADCRTTATAAATPVDDRYTIDDTLTMQLESRCL